MTIPYAPNLLWYFTHPDGRIFGAPICKLFDKVDPGYAAFLEAFDHVPGWPRDAEGAQTDAELDAVLRPFKLSMAGPLREAYGDDLLAVLTDAEVAGMSSASLRDQRTFSIQRAPFVETDATVVSIGKAVGATPKAWFDRIFAPAS